MLTAASEVVSGSTAGSSEVCLGLVQVTCDSIIVELLTASSGAVSGASSGNNFGASSVYLVLAYVDPLDRFSPTTGSWASSVVGDGVSST